MTLIPSYEESTSPTLPGLLLRTDQLDAVVQVFNTEGGGATGVLIGPRLVLTAKHVVAERTPERANAVSTGSISVGFGPSLFVPRTVIRAEAVEVMNPGQPISVHVLRRDSPLSAFMDLAHDDLALISLPRVVEDVAPIPVSAIAPSIGQGLQLSGYGSMSTWTVAANKARGWAIGTLTHYARDASGFMVRATGSLERDTGPGPGDSGGPAISADPSGAARVVGIVTGGQWMFPGLRSMRVETYVSVAYHFEWIRGAAARLLGGAWTDDKVVSAPPSSPVVPLLVGGAVVAAILILAGSD